MAYYIDTNIFIYAIENHPKYGKSCTRILRDIQEKKIESSASVLVLVELISVLVKLNKVLSSKEEAKLVIRDNIAAIQSLPIIWIDLDFLTIERAASYDYPINGVDYLHIASMEVNSLTEILSADRELDKVRSIKRIDPIDYRG
ncbi:MAG: type II toxin-antitoxin system VapC family toxin [Nitrososphaerales archaeon]